jgi:hypothetical protein
MPAAQNCHALAVLWWMGNLHHLWQVLVGPGMPQNHLEPGCHHPDAVNREPGSSSGCRSRHSGCVEQSPLISCARPFPVASFHKGLHLEPRACTWSCALAFALLAVEVQPYMPRCSTQVIWMYS